MENTKRMLDQNNRSGKKISTQTIVGVGILTALVVVLQFVSMYLLRFSMFSITLTLIPIVVGAALFGWKWGAWLGFVFGVAVLLTGDAALFMAINIPATIATVLVKGAMAGLCAGLVYKLLEKKGEVIAVLIASITAPVVNTGIFLIGCRLFFFETIKEWGVTNGFDNVAAYMFFGLAGINFLIELGTNLILNPVAVRIIGIGKNKFFKK